MLTTSPGKFPFDWRRRLSGAFSQKGRTMKSVVSFLALLLAVLTVVSLCPAQQRTIEGRGEEYHHAMYLNFKHAAEEAEALFSQASLPHTLNMEIATEHVDEIWTNLDRIRIEHAMVHKTYGSEESKLIAENHEGILLAHAKAIEAGKILKDEMAKATPNIDVVRMEAATIYQQCLKASELHMDGMKKLGLPEMKKPS